jgi:2-polyprenyl-3-methyl-5-hydroxy-6-metoxy-1,4-benzoquinol methylase
MAGAGHYGGHLSPLLRWWRNRRVAALIPAGSSILDIGCGDAALLKSMQGEGKTGVRYVGADRLSELVEDNRRVYPHQRFEQWDLEAQEPPEFGHLFDVVALVAVVEHLDQPGRTLAGLRDLLTPAGRIVVTCPRRGGETIYAAGVRLGLFSQEAHDEHTEVFPDRAFLQRVAGEAGLEMIDYRVFMFGFNQVAVFVRQGSE